jgi:hypothetical protein
MMLFATMFFACHFLATSLFAILKLHSRRVCCLAFPDNSECSVVNVAVAA